MRTSKKGIFVTLFIALLFCISVALPCKAAEHDKAYCGDTHFIKVTEKIVNSKGEYDLSSGKVYYVSNSGKNSWSGTKKRPFKTISYALTKLKKGDTLYIRGGTYKEELELEKEIAGSKSKYITISNAPGEKVVLDGSGRNGPVMIDIQGASYLKIQGIEIKNATGKGACGIRIKQGSHHIILCNNSIHDLKVTSSRSLKNYCNGIIAIGSSAKKNINNLLFYKNKIYDCQTGWAEALTVTGNVQNVNVISNTIRNTGNIGIDFAGNYGYCSDPAKDYPVNGLIYGNKVSGCVSKIATSYGIYVDGGQKITISKNTVEKCSGGIEIGAEKKQKKSQYATSDIIVENNTITGNIKRGITVGGYKTNLGWVKNVTIKNNTCKNNGKTSAILTLSKCSNVKIIGNLFYNKSGDASIVYSKMSSKYTKKITFQNNSYYNGHSKNKTRFVYLGKKYTSFDKWKKVVGNKAGTYLKK